MNISRDQLVDAASTYSERAKYQGVAFERDERHLQTPTFEHLSFLLQLEGTPSFCTLSPTDSIRLAQAPNARVMVGVSTPKGSAFLPGVVLGDSLPGEVRFGCLSAREDMRPPNTSEALQGLTAFQQALLAKIAAEHQADIGNHVSDGRLNAADIGHAVVAAALTTSANIHEQVHTLVEGRNFSAQIARSGATDMLLGGRVRENRELILTQHQIAGVVVSKEHQLPFPISDDFEVSAGFTFAAQLSRGVAPDLDRNLASMAL